MLVDPFAERLDGRYVGIGGEIVVRSASSRAVGRHGRPVVLSPGALQRVYR